MEASISPVLSLYSSAATQQCLKCIIHPLACLTCSHSAPYSSSTVYSIKTLHRYSELVEKPNTVQYRKLASYWICDVFTRICFDQILCDSNFKNGQFSYILKCFVEKHF